MIHDVEVAVEIGAETKPHAVAGVEHQAGIDGPPVSGLLPLEREFDAIGPLREVLGLAGGGKGQHGERD